MLTLTPLMPFSIHFYPHFLYPQIPLTKITNKEQQNPINKNPTKKKKRKEKEKNMSCTVAVSNSPVFSPSHHHHPSIVSSLFSSSSSSFRRSFAGDASSTSESSPPASALLKRKRPSRLDIPILPLGFGSPMTPLPVQDAVVEEDKNGFYSVCCKKGRRAAMEDRFSALLDVHGDPNKAFFGVFDGHGGVKAAEFAAKNLDKNVLAEVASTDDDNIKEAVKHGYLKTDSDFLKEDSHGGSCCVTALITDGNLVASNAGDCRAVVSRGGVAEALTTDHRPSRPDEKARIEAEGGYIDCYNGVWRIQGSLAVSRAIGDRQLKQYVIAEPETKVIRIRPDHEFLILASDGLWEKVTNQDAVDIARPFCTRSDKLQALEACKKLVDISVSRGSVDDVSVMVIQLGRYMQ